MGTKPQFRRKAITVNQVGLVALVPGIAGGVYGFLSGGMMGMIIGFIEWFAAGFVLIYICASFIELFRK
jgi:hypothetical protein